MLLAVAESHEDLNRFEAEADNADNDVFVMLRASTVPGGPWI